MSMLTSILRKQPALVPTKDDLGLILGMARLELNAASGSSAGSDIRLQAVIAMGLVGSKPAHAPHNFVIGTTLLNVLAASSSSLETLAEALNSIFDVYAEGLSFDTNFC